MEMLIEGVKNKEAIRGDLEIPKEVSAWKKVSLDETGSTSAIDWSFSGLIGTLDFQWIPSTCHSFRTVFSGLKGSINLAYLPRVMKQLTISSNLFSEEIDL
uniref:Uncharacterized protein n=1 Tax=Paramoeba aestuarina TaxID=180227 RepID=A0A7S4PCE6_9EUKA|mmetsp:Transcript_40045/g.63312  ORF Transcript_40045/g.63312 Transcript_40045/m.63312 type:complete len:101 (+) Transcript_40045:123-425(+)